MVDLDRKKTKTQYYKTVYSSQMKKRQEHVCLRSCLFAAYFHTVKSSAESNWIFLTRHRLQFQLLQLNYSNRLQVTIKLQFKGKPKGKIFRKYNSTSDLIYSLGGSFRDHVHN
jgi:hypothetical protein